LKAWIVQYYSLTELTQFFRQWKINFWYWYRNWDCSNNEQTAYHLAQTTCANLGLVCWKIMSMLLPLCQCIIMTSKAS